MQEVAAAVVFKYMENQFVDAHYGVPVVGGICAFYGTIWPKSQF